MNTNFTQYKQGRSTMILTHAHSACRKQPGSHSAYYISMNGVTVVQQHHRFIIWPLSHPRCLGIRMCEVLIKRYMQKICPHFQVQCYNQAHVIGPHLVTHRFSAVLGGKCLVLQYGCLVKIVLPPFNLQYPQDFKSSTPRRGILYTVTV